MNDFHIVRWVNLHAESVPEKSWSDRVKAAQSLKEAYRSAAGPEKARKRLVAEQAYASLITEALGIQPSEVNVVRSEAEARRGVINFDLEQDDPGKGGIAVLPTTRAGSVPTLTITLGHAALLAESPVATQQTVAHESTHEAHAQAGYWPACDVAPVGGSPQLRGLASRTAEAGSHFQDDVRSGYGEHPPRGGDHPNAGDA